MVNVRDMALFIIDLFIIFIIYYMHVLTYLAAVPQGQTDAANPEGTHL
jgi:hypothetical protein